MIQNLGKQFFPKSGWNVIEILYKYMSGSWQKGFLPQKADFALTQVFDYYLTKPCSSIKNLQGFVNTYFTLT